jgi:hypothetical protein
MALSGNKPGSILTLTLSSSFIFFTGVDEDLDINAFGSSNTFNPSSAASLFSFL